MFIISDLTRKSVRQNFSDGCGRFSDSFPGFWTDTLCGILFFSFFFRFINIEEYACMLCTGCFILIGVVRTTRQNQKVLILKSSNKTWESTFKKQSPDGAAVLPPSKSAYQSFLIRVPQSAFVVMNLGAKILPPSATSISANFCCYDTDALLTTYTRTY